MSTHPLTRHNTVQRSRPAAFVAVLATALIAVVTLTQPARAQGESAAGASVGAPDMVMKLKQLYPATTVNSVTPTTVPGVFEVVMGKNVAYVDSSGRYFFFGNLFDMQTQTDMTAPRIAQNNRIDVSKLPKKDAIKLVKGDGSRELYVFSDPDCPYCKQLEQTVAKLDNVTIYTFLFPIGGLHPDATRKSVNVWCASDQAKSWTELMLKGQQPKDSKCDNPVERNVALASSLNINGTPTLISSDGRLQPGALAEASLNAFISGPTRLTAGR